MESLNKTLLFKPGRWTIPVYLLATFAILQLFVALFNAHLSFTHEESMWHYIGRNWLRHGMVPYTGGVDNKSPLIFLVFGVSDWLFGVNYWFPRLLGTAVECIGIYYLYKIAVRLASSPADDGRRAGIFALSMYALSLLWKMSGGKLVSFTETYATTFVILSFYYCLKRTTEKNYLVSGLLAGIAIAWRFSAVFGIIAVIAAVRNLRSVLLFITGLIMALGALCLLAKAAGIHLHDIIYYGFLDNFGDGSATDHSWDWKLQSFISNFFESEMIIFYPFAGMYILLKRKFDASVAWLFLTFIGINILGIYARPHFKELLPSLSLMSALALSDLSYHYRLSYKALLILVWICFSPKIIEPLIGFKKWLTGASDESLYYCKPDMLQSNEEAEKKLGLWIKQHTAPGDPVYIAGFGARVQVFSERISPTIYFNITQTQSAKTQLFHDLEKNKPPMIAIPAFSNYQKFAAADIRSFVDSLAQRNYHNEGCMFGYSIFRLRK